MIADIFLQPPAASKTPAQGLWTSALSLWDTWLKSLKLSGKRGYVKGIFRRFFPGRFSQKEESFQAGFQFFWKGILKCLKSSESLPDRVGKINTLIEKRNILIKISPSFMETRNAAYKRNLIGIERTLSQASFEGLVIHWKKGALTPIHGHPPFAFYKVLNGLFRMDFYRDCGGGALEILEQKNFGPGEFISSNGLGKKYNNFIHSVECLEEGFTFHLYSDNALKGQVYG